MSKKDIQNTMSLKDDDDILRSIRVNRFILSSFIEQKPPAGHHAGHIDEEKPEDNSLDVLVYLLFLYLKKICQLSFHQFCLHRKKLV